MFRTSRQSFWALITKLIMHQSTCTYSAIPQPPHPYTIFQQNPIILSWVIIDCWIDFPGTFFERQFVRVYSSQSWVDRTTTNLRRRDSCSQFMLWISDILFRLKIEQERPRTFSSCIHLLFMLSNGKVTPWSVTMASCVGLKSLTLIVVRLSQAVSPEDYQKKLDDEEVSMIFINYFTLAFLT